ncbi:hypothetical protein WSM22_24020 [Cytophagales bacterium WSM2-2]|nr:hypothetical protein WSM22_24020 [Cytophagales bacterium WSM2-2]
MKILELNRRQFLQSAATSVLAFSSAPLFSQDQKRPDPLKPELVKDFVIQGHRDLDAVKKLLDETPGLLNATWDWGGGDFETALGGAGHMGRADIAEYLISKGARMDIFVASMLGKLDIVKGIADAFPDALNSRGPHKLSLIHHAEKGGEKATAVLEFLKSKGLSK